MFHRHPFLSLLTFAYLGFLGWVTLTPQPLAGRESEFMIRLLGAAQRRGYAEGMTYQRFEFLANVALFVPVGVFFLLLFGAGFFWLAGIGVVATTVGIETVQTQIPGRVPDERDLLANSLGGMAGVAVALVLTLPATIRRVRRRRARRAASW